MGKEESKEFNKGSQEPEFRSQEVSGRPKKNLTQSRLCRISPFNYVGKAQRGPRMDTNACEGEKDEPQMDADILRLATPRCGAFYRIAGPSRAA
jgi:hypothetical protein